MSATVEFSDDARRMLAEADERWVAEHGYLTANPLVEQAEQATQQLREHPESGARFRRARDRRPEIRRLLLPTGWHLYYSVDVERRYIVIVAVWWASRGNGPRL